MKIYAPCEQGEDVKPVKPGYQTSELYLACGAQISAFVVAVGTTDTTAKVVTGIIAGLALVSYIASRFGVKVDGGNL